MSNFQQRQILHLFERIHEPVFIPKSGVVYQIPDEYLPEEHKLQGVTGSFAGTPTRPTPSLVFQVNQVPIPDLKSVQTVARGKPFSAFIPSHREAANALIKIFKSYKTVEDMADAAAIIRDQVNEHIFVFAWAAALIRRPDTRSLRVPPIWEVFPDKFIERPLLSAAQTEAQQASSTRTAPIIINRNFTASDRIAENRLSYFREDLGINSHHWHWHLVYPTETTRRDRRGELFFYMHQQILARYDAERLANGLPRLLPFHNWEDPINEAYFPKLTTSNGGILWGSRPSGLILQDINIPDEGDEVGIELQVNDLERWRTRILHAIHKGSVEDESGNVVVLDEGKGIDILGDLVEASEWSVNKLLYGDLHNFGHIAICYIHDPDRAHMENMGVMGDTVTAMRDPIFYRWHKFIDSLFQQFKATLQPYTSAQLTMPGINLKSVEVQSTGTGRPKNVLITGWQESELELIRGLDFSSPLPVNARVTHLQHEDFVYTIQLKNTTQAIQEVVFRIFLAPNKDEAGRTFSLREQRLLMIEMDKFVQRVLPGKNVIRRHSSDSSVTIPFEQTFRELERTEPAQPLAPGGVPVSLPSDANRNFCGCGWPDHFLVPRGTAQPGMSFTLFVMATNWVDDRVTAEENMKKLCRDAASYCGVLDEKYPDKRPMGFPFDRPPSRDSRTLAQFLTPSMTATDIRIQFEDRVIRRYPRH